PLATPLRHAIRYNKSQFLTLLREQTLTRGCLMYPTVSLPALLSRLSRLPGEVEELVGNLASVPRNWWMHSFPYPLVNVREEADAFQVEAEAPGAPQEQSEVPVRHGTELPPQGERQPVASTTGTWHHQERGAGRFHRVLTLPVPVDANKVEARL